MSIVAPTDWRKQFGLDASKPPAFFASIEEIDAAGAAAPQPHVLRRAFKQLRLDGVLCQDKSPIIYFRQVARIQSEEVATLHRSFWYQGVAPILVLVAPDEVHVYSGLAPPASGATVDGRAAGLVENLKRVSDRLQAFLVAVESGEYFRAHRKSFDPRQRVDRTLLRELRAAREDLDKIKASQRAPQALDALLCRLVFTCYLFDRGAIDREYLEELGIRKAQHLRDVLGRKPRTEAKTELYKLFEQLGRDFNGDLFSDDLEAEARWIKAEHLDILDRFFRGTGVRSGQQSLWPYDFGVIPIETISAIYEHFLKAAGEKEKKEAGAFYTPRFLAEIVLDMALEGIGSLLDKRFLDPACGSGIFLVGLFNRLAEEWKRANPNARYDRQATALMRILTQKVFGIDRNPTACRITAFSLYLALLDQLSPPDIRQLQRKGKMLPPLTMTGKGIASDGGTIRCVDFFAEEAELPQKAHLVVSNPPWGKVKSRTEPASLWCSGHKTPFPGRQIATAFVWKASEHLEPGGQACFLLPHGTLFNHSRIAITFQDKWLRQCSVERVLNLVDYQRFLFEEAEAPALVVRYASEKPINSAHRVDYWAPKADWRVMQAEVISVMPQDKSRLSVRELLDNLRSDDAPVIWKERFWATPRDRRLLDRLSHMQRLRDIVGGHARNSARRWIIGQGFEQRGEASQTKETKQLTLPTRTIIEASQNFMLFVLEGDCRCLDRQTITVRKRSNTNTEVYLAPHVLLTNWPKHSAIVGFDAVFRHALRGIHGPKEDKELLGFLAAYLQTRLAQFFLFHTSSNWGVSRAKIHVEELLRLPFPLPEQTHAPQRCHEIVREVAAIVTDAARHASGNLVDRRTGVDDAVAAAEKLVEEYFDIDDIERMLINDTDKTIIPSVRPNKSRVDVPTIRPSNASLRADYTRLLCDTLNGWASREYRVQGRAIADTALGVGVVVLEKTRRGQQPTHLGELTADVMSTLHQLQRGAAKKSGTLELVRGLTAFDGNLLYVTKPLGQRFWTRTAALNDADEIAGTILMRSAREGA